MNVPRVSVVIPCHDHAQALERTLAALRAQTFKDIEMVVVDDGSHDRPDEVAKRYTDLPLRLVTWRENRGAPAARNEGARLTSAPYLLFLDADATLVPEALEKMLTALDAHPEVDFVYSSFHWGDKLFRGKPFDVEALRRTNYIHTSSLLRRSAFPGFDERLKRFQDWDLWLTMTEKGSVGIWVEEPLFTVEPRKMGGMSHWLPAFMYKIPWEMVGWMPEAVRTYKDAEHGIRVKHGI
jgi:glycosyltransferase involved in cell wall biosynthesis